MAVILVAFTRLVERSDAFLVVVLLPVVILLAGSAVLRADERPGRPIESLLVPAVLTGGTAAALHLVPAGLGLVPALAAFAFGLDRILALEIRLLEQSTGVTDADRARILGAAVVTAFIAFTGVAALVPGGLPEPGFTGIDSGLSEGWLLVLALGDALVALVLGYRVASVRYGSRRDAVRSALTYAIVVAVAAGALRAMDVPRLVGPAALTSDPSWGSPDGFLELQQRNGIVAVHPGGTADVQRVSMSRRIGIGRTTAESAGKVE